MSFLLTFAILAFSAAGLYLWRANRRDQRECFIRDYAWPAGLVERVKARHPTLADRDMDLVGHGLRQFFLAYLQGGRKHVSMPSQIADDLWHEFILYTRHYDAFCRQAFGGFMHHTPAAVLGQSLRANAGLRRVWHFTCKQESIDPKRPSRLPLLFALDAKLGIVGGFIYVPDCSGVRRADEDGSAGTYCGGELGESAGGSDGFGDGGDAGHGHGGGHGDGHGGGHGDGGGGDGGGDGGGCGGGCGGGD